MKAIKNNHTIITFNEDCYSTVNDYIEDHNFSTLFLLVDVNTHEHCLPYFLSNIESDIPIEIIEIEAGEDHKTIETCLGVWNALSELGADRKSLMINLGGGVVTDLGGFVACTFKRGIQYINVPTSLLAMVDASVGGKTGVDLGALKNQIGVFHAGDLVLVDTTFLESLPQAHFNSGLVEMLKHGLISSETYWKKMIDFINNGNNLDALIHGSVAIKNEIVSKDPLESGLRKTLNYGHTLGHAIETYCLSNTNKKDLLHGEAVGIGLVLESFISHKLLGFPESTMLEIKTVILDLFGKVEFTKRDVQEIIELLKYDKKNAYGKVNFVLLKEIGSCQIDCQVSNNLIEEAFNFYSH